MATTVAAAPTAPPSYLALTFQDHNKFVVAATEEATREVRIICESHALEKYVVGK